MLTYSNAAIIGLTLTPLNLLQLSLLPGDESTVGVLLFSPFIVMMITITIANGSLKVAAVAIESIDSSNRVNIHIFKTI